MRILLDEAIERSQRLWNPPRRWFRGSETGETCVRSLTLSAMGHNVPHSAKTLRIFRTGNAVEDANMQTMREVRGFVLEPPPGKKGDKYAGQWAIRYKDPPILGHIDAKTVRPADKVHLCGEIKSINSYYYKGLPREHDDPRVNMANLLAAKRGYACQWTTYSGAPNLDLPEGFILFENKDNSDQVILMLERDEDLLVQILERLREGTPYVTHDPMLAAPIPKGCDPRGGRDDGCKRCSRRYLCIRLPDEGTTYDEVRRVDNEVRG